LGFLNLAFYIQLFFNSAIMFSRRIDLAMWGLILSTIITGALDSVNPIAITQQFVLQGLVKKPRHIWYFIAPTGITNLIGGFLAYYGLIIFVGNFFTELLQRHGRVLFTLELILGICLLMAMAWMIQSFRIKALKSQLKSQNSAIAQENGEVKSQYSAIAQGNDEEKMARGIKSVSPMALIIIGVGATISELTTALPYFAFMAILFSYQLTFWQVTLILVLYNFIYTLPLMILYFLYMKTRERFDRVYIIIKNGLLNVSNMIAPSLAGVLGLVLVFHSVAALMRI
jgi:cytochrome c biogenesis protein CcdA